MHTDARLWPPTAAIVPTLRTPLAPSVSDPADFGMFVRNITLTGGVAPARAYIEELLPDVLDGVPDGYRAMADREALKVLLRP